MYKILGSIDAWSPQIREPLVSAYGSELDSLWSKWIDSTVETLKDGGDLCRHELSMIQCPTFVLHRVKDPIVPFIIPLISMSTLPVLSLNPSLMESILFSSSMYKSSMKRWKSFC